MKIRSLTSFTVLLLVAGNCLAWDYEGHRTVNQLALASLPTNFPIALTPAVRERVAFLSGEADRWRNTPDLALKHLNNPDHYIDLDELADYGLTAEGLPFMRYDFVAELARVRAARPEGFKPIDPDKNKDHTRELVGLLPWAITENYGKLKSGFSYLKTFMANGGTVEEIANAQANIIYIMGVMGHYVGDGSQPLHTTIHHHGWVGENPKGYTTNYTFHQWIDGGYFRKAGLKLENLVGKIRPARHVGNVNQPDGMFRAVMDYLVAANKLVEPLYRLEKEGKLSPRDGVVDAEGRAFLEGRLIVGGQMLGDIWFAAWQDAAEDKYLKGELEKRQSAKQPAKAAAPVEIGKTNSGK